MNFEQQTNLTAELNDYHAVDQKQKNELFNKIYAQLKKSANAASKSHSRSVLNPTALVNEVFIKLFSKQATWLNQNHFFAVAAKAMRQIMVDEARSRSSLKRGKDWVDVTFTEDELSQLPQENLILEVNDFLSTLAEENEKLVSLIELKFFVGLSNKEVGDVTGISLRTVQRQWDDAKQLMQNRLAG
jgi:RNA polymerase sigma factor (TIGR02999 family)